MKCGKQVQHFQRDTKTYLPNYKESHRSPQSKLQISLGYIIKYIAKEEEEEKHAHTHAGAHTHTHTHTKKTTGGRKIIVIQ
jgi:hypothetical protein